MKLTTVKDLMRPGKRLIYIQDGTAKTVGELIDLLSSIPRDYDVSLSGYTEYAIAVDPDGKAILIDDAKWIDEHVYQLYEESEE